MHEGLPTGSGEHNNGDDPFGFGTLEELQTPEQPVASPEQDRKRADLIRAINEQIPFLAYGLSEKIQRNGLGGKVSIRGMIGSSWGVGVSKNNPRKDIPNIVVYPESILSEDRAVTNAQLRHEVGNLNHSIDGEMAELAKWCEQHGQDYRLMAPLVEAVQEASVNYLEMRNSISDDPAAAFRPLYEKVIPVKAMAEDIGSGLEYKQAVDMTLLKSLGVAGLVDQETLKVANDRLSDDVRASFSEKIGSVIGQAVRTSSGKIRVQLVRDYLWPELSKFIPEVGSETASREQLAENLGEHSRATTATERALDILKKSQGLSEEELSERASANASLSNEIQDKANQLSEQLSSLGSEEQSADKEKQGANIQEQLEKLQSLLDDLKNPEKASGDDLESLKFKINEIGINEAELDESRLKLLNNLREFCKTTTVTYVRTMRFIMEEYKSRNPNFTDEMMQKMILRGHDTPSFTIYGKEAGEDFIENTCSELGIEGFESNGMVLNFNLPDILGRFWYRGGVGAKAQPVPEGAIEWGHFYRSGMPAIWRSVDAAPRKGLFLDRLNAFGQHDYKKYYYLYDAMGLDFDLGEQQESSSDNDSTNQETNSDENNSENDSSSESTSSDGANRESGSEAGESGQGESGESGGSGGFGESGGVEQGSGDGTGQMGDFGGGNFGEMDSSANQGDMQEQLSRMLDELNSLMSGQGGGDNRAIMDALSKALQDSQSGEEMSESQGMGFEGNENSSEDGANEQGGFFSDANSGGETDNETSQFSENGSGQSQGSGGDMQGEASSDQSQDGGNGSGDSRGENSPSRSEQGGLSNQRELSELFSQLQETQEKLESSFSESMSEQGSFQEYDIDDQDIEPDTVESIDNLEAIKEQQQRQLESIYREQSGLSGEALGRYIDYREETRAFTDDLVSYFTEKFKMDTEYTYENNQRRGNRLQRGWTSKILGRTALGTTAIEPEVFERRSIPKKPQFVWSVIIDNSGSCSGDIIEEEKKTAVALTEVASRLDIPLEIVTFGGPNEYTFLKTFDQELYGDQLSRLVQLDADQGTPDIVTLNAACSSVADYADSFNRPYNFVYFMTDGESGGSGSIQSVIGKFKRDMVITGVGLADAADSISRTWGKNSVGVEDVSKLSDTLIRKIEDQIEETFD